MAYTPVTSSPDGAIVIALDTTTSALCFSVDSGSNFTDLASAASAYKSLYTGAQIDSAVSAAINTNNWSLLRQITSTSQGVSIGGAAMADKSYVDGLAYIPLASGATAGLVSGGSQITMSDGKPSLVTSNVSALWQNVQSKQYATTVSFVWLRMTKWPLVRIQALL